MRSSKLLLHSQIARESLIFKSYIPTLTIEGLESRYPVRRVYCVGLNYYDHVIEMGKNPMKESPLFFSKPADAVVDSTRIKSLPLPPHSNEVDWECEVVVAIGRNGAFISPEVAEEHIFGYAMGVDLTARDLQRDAKSNGRPWDLSKGFDYSAPVGKIIPKDLFGHLATQQIKLTVNGILKQDSTVDKMIWNISQIIYHLSSKVELKQGDLIFTGTPKGVGALKPGDKVVSSGDGFSSCEFEVTAPNINGSLFL